MDSTINRDQIIEVLKKIEDPEIHIDIWTLGLVYQIDIHDNAITLVMTYTTPLCPFGETLKHNVELGLKTLNPRDLSIKIVFTPAWKPSDELRAALGV